MILGSHRPSNVKLEYLHKKKNKWNCCKTTNYAKSESLCVNGEFISDCSDFKLSVEKQIYQGQNNHIILIFKIEYALSFYKWNLKKNPGWYIIIVNTACYVSSSLDSACEGIRGNIKLCLRTNNNRFANCPHLFEELLSKIVGCHVL